MIARTVLLAFALLLFSLPRIDAAEFFVNNMGDSGQGTLRQAVLDAETDIGGDDVIRFEALLSGQKITLSTPIAFTSTSGSIRIDGSNLNTSVAVSGGGVVRVFTVAAGVDLTLTSIDVVEGKAADGGNGSDGAIPTDGQDGENGGAIHNAGTLLIESCRFLGNNAGDAGAGGLNEGSAVDTGASGGDGGSGGAIFNDSTGVLTIRDTIFDSNGAGSGGTGGSGESTQPGLPGDGGDGGNGGAIYNEGVLEAERVVLFACRGGDGGTGGAHGSNGTGGIGGFGGSGGAVVSLTGTVRFFQCSFQVNTAGFGGMGGNSTFNQDDNGGPGGNGGSGGALVLVRVIGTPSTLPAIESCLFLENFGGGGAPGGIPSTLTLAGSGTDGGNGGDGGALVILGALSNGTDFRIVNSTFDGNVSGDGGKGGDANLGGTGGNGGDAGRGGAIYLSPVFANAWTANMIHCTILENEVGPQGLPGAMGSPSFGAAGSGGGIFAEAALSLILTNSIVAQNVAPAEPNTTAFTGFGANLTAGDPLVEAIGLNGGPTATRIPLPGSPAIDAAPSAPGVPAADQRGLPRSNGGGVLDIGAVELVKIADLRIGAKSSITSHRFDNVYSPSSGGRLKVTLKRGKGRFFFTAQNDGELTETLFVRSNRPKRTIKLKAFQLTGGRANVTAALSKQGVLTPALGAGQVSVFQVKVSPKVRGKSPRGALNYTASPGPTSTITDSVSAKLKGK